MNVNVLLLNKSSTLVMAGHEEELINMSIYPNFPWDYLEDIRGPQHLPLATAIPLTIINVIIFVTGLLGNIAVCVVIIRHPSMHTATNYYLFNLAVSDLTLLTFGLPNDILVFWHQYPWPLGELFCKLRALISEMASYVSVLTIVAFSTERYLAICHPLYLYTMSGFHRAVRIISVVWLISFFSALPFSFYTNVDLANYPSIIPPNTNNNNNNNNTNANSNSIANIDSSSQINNNDLKFIDESAFCGMLDTPIPINEISFLAFFILPMLVIALEYVFMGVQIAKRTRQSLGRSINGHRSCNNRRSHSHKVIIRMLAVVVIGFFVSWAPFHAQRLIYIYAGDYEHFHLINEYVFYITGILYYLSSTLNPILYNIMSNRYRAAFKEILCGKLPPQRNSFTRTSTIRETTQTQTQRISPDSPPISSSFIQEDEEEEEENTNINEEMYEYSSKQQQLYTSTRNTSRNRSDLNKSSFKSSLKHQHHQHQQKSTHNSKRQRQRKSNSNSSKNSNSNNTKYKKERKEEDNKNNILTLNTKNGVKYEINYLKANINVNINTNKNKNKNESCI